MNIYFFLIGIVALFRAIHPILTKLHIPLHDRLRERQFHIKMAEEKHSNDDIMHIDFKFDFVDVIGLFLCVLIGVWYLLKRHWISNNIFGIAFSINAIEILHFNK